MLSHGTFVSVKTVIGDLFSGLLDIFDAGGEYAVMSMVTLKVVKPQITVNMMSTYYRRTFVCGDYPGTTLFQNSITDLLQKVG